MRFFWLRWKESQNMFRVYWRPGTTNLADYFMNHHSAAHHKKFRPEFLTESNLVNKRKLSLRKKTLQFSFSRKGVLIIANQYFITTPT